jgi:hypothetical protein
VVDPLQNSLDRSKCRLEEVVYDKNTKQLFFIDNTSKLPDDLAIAIISTSADIRYEILKKLLSTKKVTQIVLEKVLFQDLNAYAKAFELLINKNVKCWVNHPRRMFPFYQNLKKELSLASYVKYDMQGGNWGMACNALHFLDHFAFLTGSGEIDIKHLDIESVFNSKRFGFVEFTGVLKATAGVHSCFLTAYNDSSPSFLTIKSDWLVAIIDEVNGYVRLARKQENWQWKCYQTKILYFQSELTNGVIDEILTVGLCDLPTYHEAATLHSSFIPLVLKKINLQGNNYEICPIT